MDISKIRRLFELGCEVKGLGRGDVKRIKDEVKKKKLRHKSEIAMHGRPSF